MRSKKKHKIQKNSVVKIVAAVIIFFVAASPARAGFGGVATEKVEGIKYKQIYMEKRVK